MNFIDICSGIGGFRTGLERNGHDCIAFAEIDKYAIQSYKAIYDTENEVELGDITTMDDSEWEQFKGNCDMIVGGTPCQSFSIAGKRLGFEDTRGTVFFSYVNAIKQVQPKYFLFENVKGLMSHDKGNTIKVILKAFDEVGYDLDFEVFNSKYYGVPQNRERIYIVGIRKDLSDKPFKPVSVGKKKMDSLKAWATCEVSYKQIHPDLQTEVTTRLIDVLEDEVDEKYYLSDEKTKKLTLDNDLGGKLNVYDYNERDKVHSVNKVSPTLKTMQGGDRQPKIAINQIGNIVDNKETFGGNPQRGRVYNSKGLSPALNSMRGGGLEPKVVVIGNTSNTGHGSQDAYNIEGISPTIQARDYKGAKQIAEVQQTGNTTDAVIPVLTPDRVNKRQNGRRFKEDGEPMFTLTSQDRHGIAVREVTKQGYTIAEQVDNTLNFYAKDNVVYDEEQYKKLVKANNDFEVDYIYVEPTLYQLDEKHILLINNDQNQFEVIEIREGYYLTLKVASSLDELNLTTYKKEFGRFGRQAVETLNKNKDIVNDGMTVNAYNKTLDDSGLSPTLTTRPEGFKTAILPITNDLRIRKLTPLECWRLQGFTDEQFYKAQNDGVSNSQLYKQAGNSVTVNVVDAIVKELK